MSLYQSCCDRSYFVIQGQHYHLAAWLASGRTFYEPVFVYEAAVSLDPARLQKTWRALRLRHSTLRTAFVATSSTEAIQVVLGPVPEEDPTWSSIELSGDFKQKVVEQTRLEYARSADLFSAPVRAKHVRVGQRDALLLKLHHALYGKTFCYDLLRSELDPYPL
jgi:hypothetical protein